MTRLSPSWVLLAAVACCCGLMAGEVGAAVDVNVAPDLRSIYAKHMLSGSTSRGFDAKDNDIDIDEDTIHRRLESHACGDEIGLVTQVEMKALASTLLTVLLTQFGAINLLENTLNYFASSLRYDVMAYKVCGSCAETEAMLSQEALLQDESVFGSFASYCGSDKFGYSAQHSALVFVPVTTDPATSVSTVAEGSLRSFVNMHVTLASVSDAPTELWPTNLTDALTGGDDDSAAAVAEILADYFDFLAPLVAAGSGAVSILPDYVGFGASVSTHNRTYAYPPTYQQAAVTSWMATKAAMEQDTYGWSSSLQDGAGGCTTMDFVVSVSGVSEGGNAAIAAAPGLQQAGVRVLSISAGATFLDPGEQLEFSIGMCVCV
jgi:hypothetical protein